MWYRRPLDIDDDQLESVQLNQTARTQPRHETTPEDPGWGGDDHGDCDVYGQGVAHRDSLHTQPKPDGPTERSINQVILVGRVGTDPQIRGSESRPITTFSLATNSVWKTQNTHWTWRLSLAEQGGLAQRGRVQARVKGVHLQQSVQGGGD